MSTESEEDSRGSCPTLIDDLNYFINYCICQTDLKRSEKHALRTKWAELKKEIEALVKIETLICKP